MAVLMTTMTASSAWVAPASSTTISPTYPTNAVGDLVVALIVVKPDTSTIATPANWTAQGSYAVGGGTQGIGTGACKVFVFSRVVSTVLSGSQAFTITSGSSPVAHMKTFSPQSGATGVTWSIGGALFSRTTASTTFGGTSSGSLAMAAGDCLCAISVSADDQSANHTFNSITPPAGTTGGTMVVSPAGTVINGQGNDISAAAAYIDIASGSATGTVAASITGDSSETGGVVFLSIRQTGTAPPATWQGVVPMTSASTMAVGASVTMQAAVAMTATSTVAANATVTTPSAPQVSTPSILSAPNSAVTETGLTVVSGTFTPSANALVVVALTTHGGAPDTSPIPATAISFSGTGVGTWISGPEQTPATGLAIATHTYYAQAGSSPTSGAITVTLTDTPTDAKLGVFEVTGHNQSSPTDGFATAGGNLVSSLSATLTATPSTGDMVIGLAGSRNDVTNMTVGTGFTALWNAGKASPSASNLLEYKTNTTSTTVDAAGMNTASYSSLSAFIIKAAAGTGGTTYSAAAVMSASSVMAVAAVVEKIGAAVLSATSTLLTDAVVIRPAAVTMSATSTVVAGATVAVTYAGAVSMTAASTLAANAVVTKIGAVSMTATSTLAAAATATGSSAGASAMTATSVLTANAFATRPAAVAMSATSALVTDARVEKLGAVVMTASSVLTANAIRTAVSMASMTASSNLVAAAQRSTAGVIGMTATSVLTANAVAQAPGAGASNMTASSVLVVAAIRTTAAAVAMTATSTLAANAVPSRQALASMTATSSLTVNAFVVRRAIVAMVATSTLTSTGRLTKFGAVPMTATSTLVAAALVQSLSVFFLWNGTAAEPLQLAGQWNGSSLDAISYGSVV